MLPDAVAEWRLERGMSQEELAEASKVSGSLIALIETGRRQPGITNALAIAKALTVPITAIATVNVDLAELLAVLGEAPLSVRQRRVRRHPVAEPVGAPS
ncbi:MAG: Helix-turn-helix domain [Actinomycetia bacterium]|nr:Helix-turn-helix domain [Actinomycetes bacterium]